MHQKVKNIFALLLTGTTCPSENELRVRQRYDHWDEKLAQQLGTTAPNTAKMENESWHAVTSDVYVFSAFLVTTKDHAIHVISLVRDHLNAKHYLNLYKGLVCLVRSSAGTREHAARIQLVWTWRNPTYKNAFILCPPPEEHLVSSGNIQVAVSVRGANNSTLSWLQLHVPLGKAGEKCCAVCVRPAFGKLSLWKLAEFFAHYRNVGADKFYFYDLAMRPEVKMLFGTLQAAGIDITLVPFKLLVNSSEVHAEGQMSGLYDCIFRSMSRNEYFIHVDIDELMVPLGNSRISAIIEEAESQESKDAIGSIGVKSRFYCAEYPVDLSYWSARDVPLQTRTFTYRSRDLGGEGLTKYIGRSRAICNAGVHTVVAHCGMSREKRLEGSVAVINHYRRCCGFKDEHLVILLKIPLRNFTYGIAHAPSKQYITAIEDDLVIRTLITLMPSV